MASLTPNLNLYKPDRTEYVSVISDINNNMDRIDTAFTELVQATETKVDNSIAPIDISDCVSPVITTSDTATITDVEAYKSGNIIYLRMRIHANQTVSSTWSLFFGIEFTNDAYMPLFYSPMEGNNAITGWGFVKFGTIGSAYTINFIPFRQGIPGIYVESGGAVDVDWYNDLSVMYVCRGEPVSPTNPPVIDNEVTPTLITGDDYSMNF